MRRRLAPLLTLLFTAALALAQEPAAVKQTDGVRLSVTFTDDKGRPAAEVRREGLRVLIDGVEQPVTYFEREEAPASYGLVVDNSGSLNYLINYVVAAAKVIVAANRPGDETFVVRFVSADNIRIMTDLTSDPAVLGKGLDSMFLEGGQTAVVDAVYLSAEYLQKNAAAGAGRRRALVLITDGEDRQSYYKPEKLLDLLKRTGIQVHCIGLVGDLDKEPGLVIKSKRERAVALLKRIAGETGGRLLLVNKARSELQQAVDAVINDLHSHYVLGYTPAPGTKPGARAQIKVLERKGSPKLKATISPPTTNQPVEPEAKKKSR